MMGYPCLVNGNLTTAIEGMFTLQELIMLLLLVEIHPHEKRKSVFQCKIFGSRQSGKSTIVRALVGKQDNVSVFCCHVIHKLLIMISGASSTG